MGTSWFRSLRLDAPVPEVTLVSAPQLMWYFPDGYCLPRVRQAVNISVSRCENEPARKRRKKTSAFELGLGILHSVFMLVVQQQLSWGSSLEAAIALIPQTKF